MTSKLVYLPDQESVLARLKSNLEKKKPDLIPTRHQWPSTIYTSQKAYLYEKDFITNKIPVCLGVSSQLKMKPNAYSVREIWNSSWIIWNTRKSEYHAYLNRCRHRGMKLVDGESGVATKIVCPYHQWAYGQDGVCTFIPEGQQAFSGLESKQIQLHQKKVVETSGLLWLMPESSKSNSESTESGATHPHMSVMQKHFESWSLDQLNMKHFQVKTVKANWKIIQEAFLEAYHVPFVHKSSLSPVTVSNIWLNDYFGPHSRAVYPLKRLAEDFDFIKAPLRRYISVVYQIFPNTLISFQPFHVIFTQLWPISTGETRVESTLMAHPEDLAESPKMVDRDIEFVQLGLAEDFSIAEKIQEALQYGQKDEFIAGPYETQIEHFHKHLQIHQMGMNADG